MFSALLFCSLAFAESKTLALQIALDRAGFSCNTIDGQWGRKSERALAAFEKRKQAEGPRSKVEQRTMHSAVLPVQPSAATPQPFSPEQAYDRYFAHDANLFRVETVTQDDLNRLVKIPKQPADKANLPRMGYESIREMFAERGHLSTNALTRMNPGVNWNRITAGTKLVIPNFPSIESEFKSASRPNRVVAERVVVDLGHFEITVFGKGGEVLALFPCSIAAKEGKRPAAGELKVVNAIARPNYTYTPDFTPRGQKPKRYVWPEGENCPIGVAWLGLNLPGYGMHGTPKPETIGRPESHGCFRLANWNAARLYALCPPGTPVIIRQ